MKNLIVPFGLLLILLATITPFFLRDCRWAVDSFRYVYCAGAIIVLIGRIFQKRPATSDLRLRRLYRLEVWIAIIFCVAGFFAFYSGELRDWIAFTLAGAALQAYTSIAIPSREDKVK